MRRREFLRTSSQALLASWITSQAFANPLPKKYAASDTVTLGKTGITTSRLAMGTGTYGFGGRSQQTQLGIQGLANLLDNGYDNGLRFFDTASGYGSHPHVAEALKRVQRDKVCVMTKDDSRDPATMRANLDKFRKQLGTDYIDIYLIHCVTEGDWTTRYRGIMDVLEEAKQKKIIRAHGVSCHSFEALQAAAASPWVEVDLARINPIGSHMDSSPDEVVPVLRQMKMQGKAVIGMKILGQGDLRNRQDEAIKYALSLGILDAFTIGAESKEQQADLIRRIATA